MKQFCSILFALFAAVALSGCGESIGTLHGKVTYRNVPVTQGTVTVVNGNGFFATAEIQPDGTYQVENCPGGKVNISVSSPDPKLAEEARKQLSDKARGGLPPSMANMPGASGDPKRWVEIPPVFGNPDTSGLTTNVSGTTEYDLKLE